MAWVMTAPSADMRVANQGGTRPPWRGRSALPVRLAIRSRNCCVLKGPPSEFWIGHRPERNRVARRRDAGNAVFPHHPRFVRHPIERARLGIQRVALPFVAGRPAETELAG